MSVFLFPTTVLKLSLTSSMYCSSHHWQLEEAMPLPIVDFVD